MSESPAPKTPRPSLLDRVIRFCLEKKLVVALIVLFILGRGVLVAPFGWDVADAGAQVVLTSRTNEAAERAATELGGDGRLVHGIALDVASDESVERAVKALSEGYDTISILVNNAGVTRDGLLLRMKKEDLDLGPVELVRVLRGAQEPRAGCERMATRLDPHPGPWEA